MDEELLKQENSKHEMKTEKKVVFIVC